MEHDDKLAHDAEFARWYRSHHDRIRALCARILRDPNAAEDVAQETLLRAWERREQMREEDLGAWLSVVARNLCLSSLRKDGRVLVTDEVPDRADYGADPAVEVGRRESRHNVRRALAKLGPRSRKVIDLREVREADYEEIGSELGLSPEGARAIAFRARKAMREHLAAVGEGFGSWIVMVRIRIRGAVDRMTPSARQLIEGGLSPALQVGLGFALATATMFGGTHGDVVRSRLAASPAEAVSGAAGTGSALRTGAVANGAADIPVVVVHERERAGFSAGIDTDSDPSLGLGTKAPNPITGPETAPYVTIWFNEKGPVTPRVIDAYGELCSHYGSTCEEIGKTIDIGGGS
jgi:RNA polymerase sigma factor (sigma-70 family)